ncbi:putative transcription factor NAM family [Helianthus debilis subsp. tardiflorus]
MSQHDPHMRSIIYRFYPTEEELILFYLSNKLQNRRTHDLHRVIPTVNVYEHTPSHLPSKNFYDNISYLTRAYPAHIYGFQKPSMLGKKWKKIVRTL